MSPPYELVDERTIVNTCDFKTTKTYPAQLPPPRGEQGQRIIQENGIFLYYTTNGRSFS